jgi:glycosyltransferase involved in cell wall biosynthesis
MKQPSQSARQGKPKVAAAIPAFNEEQYIGSVVLKARQYVDETIVVDDGSTDQTAKIARLAGATVIQHERNQGYGASIKTLLAEAKKKGFDILVLLDGDSQHNPDEIPNLVKPISEGFDIVIGSREQQKNDIPAYRRLGQRVIARFSHVLSGENLSDSESGFRVFSRKAIELLDLKENGMAISAETISRATENSLKITERPISVRYTADGSTLNPVAHGVGVMSRIIAMISERRPLFFFGWGGAILVILGLLAGIRAFDIVINGGNALTGYALVSVLLLVVGIFSIFTGIILNTLMKRRG